jgi:hypothetical protein
MQQVEQETPLNAKSIACLPMAVRLSTHQAPWFGVALEVGPPKHLKGETLDRGPVGC